MADFYSAVTVHPEKIPADAFTETEKTILERMGFTFYQLNGNGKGKNYVYLSSFDYSGSVYLEAEEVIELGFVNNNIFLENVEDMELGEDYVTDIFKRICKEHNIPFIYMQGNTSCSVCRADSFGGWAVFITAKSVTAMSTAEWISKKMAKINNKRRLANGEI
ncbi:MAG: hypothetical protein KAS32_12085 [Candidatus Peribacteraceae bacterium]|nr:hypothetical protein [Candidatus Peribacteraceae bacterium]